ncbi:MAG: PQQ-dependent sugar dehydrogenase [Solirubrobacterales bacterium]
MLISNQSRRWLICAATAALLVVPWLVARSMAAESEGTKHPPKTVAKKFDIVTLASGFVKPTSVAFLPDGTMLVSQKGGRLFSVASSGRKKLLLDLSDQVANERERGLGTVEVAHDFATSHRVYLSYTYRVNPAKPDGPQAMRVSSITLNPDGSLANPGSPETLVLGKDATGPCPPANNRRDCPPSIASTHQGGTVISDKDGSLWVAWGESNLPENPGKQVFRTYNPASTSGKLLHVDAQGNGLRGHPFCRSDRNLIHTCTKVFARGFRNPFRFTLGRDGKPLVSDVGWNTEEEIDAVRKGGNYGWPCYEGDIKTPFYRDMTRCKQLYRQAGKAGIEQPIYTYRNPTVGAGAAVIIGPQYPGGLYPKDFNGSFFYGDYALGLIGLLHEGKGGVKVRRVANGVTPVDFNFAPNGDLVFVDYQRGAIRELVFSPANKSPRPQITASPSSGHAPLGVQFSAAGTLDPDGDAISYAWDFGDGGSSAGPAPAHTYAANGSYNVRLTASDGRGGTATTTTVVTVGNTAPTATILAPTPTTLSRDGQAVALQATGTDPEGGPLGSSAFDWDVTLVHKDHEHPLGEFVGASTQFTAIRDHDADSHYAVTLTVTDGQGLSTMLPPVNVNPETVKLAIRSKPKGVKLSYGGRAVKAPLTVDAAIGFLANLSAPETATIKGREYHFAGWSQKGKRVQIFSIPDHETKILARYRPGPAPSAGP